MLPQKSKIFGVTPNSFLVQRLQTARHYKRLNKSEFNVRKMEAALSGICASTCIFEPHQDFDIFILIVVSFLKIANRQDP
eukprot:scaffold915_cov259-Chaetoceros_neogracile.AAC.3